jgi:hypothetical protein
VLVFGWSVWLLGRLCGTGVPVLVLRVMCYGVGVRSVVFGFSV